MSNLKTSLQSVRDAFDTAENQIIGARSMEEFLVARLRLNQLHELWERCFDEQRSHLLTQQVAAALVGILDDAAAIQTPDFANDDE